MTALEALTTAIKGEGECPPGCAEAAMARLKGLGWELVPVSPQESEMPDMPPGAAFLVDGNKLRLYEPRLAIEKRKAAGKTQRELAAFLGFPNESTGASEISSLENAKPWVVYKPYHKKYIDWLNNDQCDMCRGHGNMRPGLIDSTLTECPKCLGSGRIEKTFKAP